MITGAAAFLHSFLELSSYTIMGAGGRSGGVASIDPGPEGVFFFGGAGWGGWFGFFTVASAKPFGFKNCAGFGLVSYQHSPAHQALSQPRIPSLL